MRVFKALIIVVIVVLFLRVDVGAQLKSQVGRKMSVEERIKLPGVDSAIGGLFSSDRFFMRQSYSLSFFSMGGINGSVGMYVNRMSFLISDKLLLNAKIGFIHTPFNRIGNSGLFNNLIYGAELLYRPTENTFINLKFDAAPYYYPYYMYMPR